MSNETNTEILEAEVEHLIEDEHSIKDDYDLTYAGLQKRNEKRDAIIGMLKGKVEEMQSLIGKQ